MILWRLWIVAGARMLTISDAHILIFWQDDPTQLSKKAKQTLEKSFATKSLACSDISFWEIAMLFKAGRLRNDILAEQYMNDIILIMSLTCITSYARNSGFI